MAILQNSTSIRIHGSSELALAMLQASTHIPNQLHVFISHSAAQTETGFSTDLYHELSSLSYSVFFYPDHHFLPPSHAFPPLVLSAAHSCQLAIVVLSEEFLTSRWSMMELCLFSDRFQSASCEMILLPLFYKISPEDIKKEEKLNEWREIWKGFENSNSDDGITADKCESVVTKLLPCLNGIVRRPVCEQGEASYIGDVVDAVLSIYPPPTAT